VRLAWLRCGANELGIDEFKSIVSRHPDCAEARCRQLAARARANVRAARPRGVTAQPSSSRGIDAKHAQLMSIFTAATQSGDLNALTQLLAKDVRVITDSGGKVRSALNAIEGVDRVAQFLVEVTRKRPGAWWRDDFTMRFAMINGLPGIVVDSPEGPVQTAAFEIEGGVVRALYVVRNPDKLRHLAPTRPERGPWREPRSDWSIQS